MDFTREPIIETVITPKEGSKLVVRSSKSNGQEEHFVDALEVVSFGHSFFFRSLERPKTFLVPATDYEVLEVREARMVLKNVGIDRAIKIAGGREAPMRGAKEAPAEKAHVQEEVQAETNEEQVASQPTTDKPQESRSDKKRDRRRNYRRRGRGRDAGEEELSEGETAEAKKPSDSDAAPLAQQVMTTSILTSLLPPPSMLISETIAHYKDKFKEAFYPKDEDRKQELKNSEDSKAEEDSAEDGVVELEKGGLSSLEDQESPHFGSFDMSLEDEEDIYKQRHLQSEHSNNVSDLSLHMQEESPLESVQEDETNLKPFKEEESR